jgi:hypothetical protein
MAKIKFGALAADARGKIDGVVYSKNQFGSYIRQKVSPVQPQSERQTLVRERQTTLSKRFSTVITVEQRQAWRGFATVNPVPDVFGNPQALTGVASYVRLNQVILNGGGSIIDTPPADLEVPGLFSISGVAFGAGVATAVTSGVVAGFVLTATVASHPYVVGQRVALSGFAGDGAPLNGQIMTVSAITATTVVGTVTPETIAATGAGTITSVNQLDIAYTPTPLGAGLRLYVFGTQGLNAGVEFFKPLMRFLGVSAAAQASPFDMAPIYTAKFGDLIVGKAIGVTVAVVDITKGALTPGLFLRLVVA